MERTPWTFDAILAVAGKIRSGNGPLSPTFYKCLEEAQGIARSSLFGPVVRKEAVQGPPLMLESNVSMSHDEPQECCFWQLGVLMAGYLLATLCEWRLT